VKRLAFLLFLVVLVAGACGGSDDDMPRRAVDYEAAEPTLTDLTSVDQLRERFNAHRGLPRLIVLVAPT
jgi:hypothetical protein